MKSFTLSAAALAATLVPAVFAQTFTSCNPLNTTGCPDMPALGGNTTFAFNDTLNENVWNTTGGKPEWAEKGQTFTIKQRGDSPTIKSNFYIFFGRVSAVLKAAPGKGVVSSFILQSEDLDEIDFEFLGSNNTHVLTNYYGKGNTTYGDRGLDVASAAPQEQFHNYTLLWTKDSTQWWIDDKMVRELKFADAIGGKNYPQTPMTVRMGIWAGGDVKSNDPGVVKWAGGETDFAQAPFTMTVQQLYVEDFHTAKTYQWGDQTGSYQSIKVVDGKSDILTEIQKPHGAKNRFKALSKGAQIGIAVGVLAFVGIAAFAIFFYFIKQRRAGRREYNKQMDQNNKEAAELMEYKNQMQSGRFAQGNHYR